MKPILKPLNAKSNEFEMQARTSLIALENNVATAAHLVNFYVLSDIVQRIRSEKIPTEEYYAMNHSYSIKRLCEEIYANGYKATPLQYNAMRASTDVLVRYLHTQRNADIYDAAKKAIKELS